MKKMRQWGMRGIVGAVALCLLAGVAFAASTAGSSSDPLVSYSYFTTTVIPDLLAAVEGRAETTAEELRTDFDSQVTDYTAEMEALAAQAVAQGAGSSASSGAYSVINLAAGESVTLNAGAEVMLRIGSATVSGGSPALIDSTDGTELSDGGSLTTNHIYLCTINGRTLTAGNSSTWILLRQ